MILADENIDHSIILDLRNSGIEVYSIYENERGISDTGIISLSKKPQKVILTEDTDFGEWVYAHNEKEISVILLRYSFPDTRKISKILVDFITDKSSSLFGKFCVVTVNKIRIKFI